MRRKIAMLLVFGTLSSFWGCQSETVEPVSINTIEPAPDTTAPTATILPMTEDQFSLQFEIAFEAQDDDSGVASVEIFARTPDQVWTSLGFYNQSPVTFVATESGPHGFIGVAVDSMGNRQKTPDLAQAETMVPAAIIITDQRGEDFDITNAVLRYFMSEHAWGHGLGRDTIRPINDPVFRCPGEQGYPASNLLTDVMGVAIGGEARAYPPGDFSNREVVNDVVGGVHLSATY